MKNKFGGKSTGQIVERGRREGVVGVIGGGERVGTVKC